MPVGVLRPVSTMMRNTFLYTEEATMIQLYTASVQYRFPLTQSTAKFNTWSKAGRCMLPEMRITICAHYAPPTVYTYVT